ncbi:hypothetical protein [Halovenus sp. HT40]|uniref:hypothetical protein n=1 Tax=Halovenus sp. HT40 TaxID=3126691 RepID=UPI00300EAFF1
MTENTSQHSDTDANYQAELQNWTPQPGEQARNHGQSQREDEEPISKSSTHSTAPDTQATNTESSTANSPRSNSHNQHSAQQGMSVNATRPRKTPASANLSKTDTLGTLRQLIAMCHVYLSGKQVDDVIEICHGTDWTERIEAEVAAGEVTPRAPVTVDSKKTACEDGTQSRRTNQYNPSERVLQHYREFGETPLMVRYTGPRRDAIRANDAIESDRENKRCELQALQALVDVVVSGIRPSDNRDADRGASEQEQAKLSEIADV